MNTINIYKLLDSISTYLKSVGNFYIPGLPLLPVLYVMVAAKKGYSISLSDDNASLTISKNEDPLQFYEDEQNADALVEEIRDNIHHAFLEGEPAKLLFELFTSCEQYFKDYYQEIVELILTDLSQSRIYNHIEATSPEIDRLMGSLLLAYKPKRIYYPYSGLCPLATLPELIAIPFIGQEIRGLKKVLGDIRLDAAGRTSAIYWEDPVLNWRGDEVCDVLASMPELGVRLPRIPEEPERPLYLDEYILYKFMNTPSLKKCVLLLPFGACSRPGRGSKLRKTLLERNWVDAVIKLPGGVLPFAPIYTAVMMLDKERSEDTVKFIDAEDCVLENKKKRTLDYQRVLDRVFGKDDDNVACVPVSMASENGYLWVPIKYLPE